MAIHPMVVLGSTGMNVPNSPTTSMAMTMMIQKISIFIFRRVVPFKGFSVSKISKGKRRGKGESEVFVPCRYRRIPTDL